MTIIRGINRSIQNLNWVFCSIFLSLFIYAFIFSWLSWRQEKLDQINNMQNIMELGEKAINSYFIQLQNGLLGLTREIFEIDGQIEINHAFIKVKQFKENHLELTNITFIRRDGQILFTATSPPSPNLPTLAKEPSFLKFCDEIKQGQPLTIGQPLVGLVTHAWMIPIRFVINDEDGKLDYILSANLPVEMLQNFWKDAPFTKTSALGLMRDDGFLVSRYPVPPNLDMATVYGKPRTGVLINFLKQENFPIKGYVEGLSSLDGPNYLNVFQRLEHFPVTLFIASPTSEIVKNWWDKVKVPYILLSVLIIMDVFIYRKTIQHEQDIELERRQNSKAQRDFNRFLNGIIENSPVSMWISDDKGTLIRANQSLYDSLHVTDDELVGKYNIFYDRQIEDQGLIPLVRDVFEKGYTARFTIEYDTSLVQNLKLKKSKHATLDVTISAILNSEGKVVNAIIQHMDISAQKQNEKDLAANEKKFREIINISPIPLMLIDYQQNITILNKAFIQTFGFTTEDISTLAQWQSIVFPNLQYRQLVTDAWQDKMDQIDQKEITVRCKYGKEKIVLISAASYKSLIGGEHLLMMYDITDRKASEGELAKYRNHLENLVEHRTLELQQENNKRTLAEKRLQEANASLQKKASELEEMNTALKVLVKNREKEIHEVEEKIFYNYELRIKPFIEILQTNYTNIDQQNLVTVLEASLKEIITPFSKKLSDPLMSLTPKEIQIVSCIKKGLSNKETAQILICSVRTIEAHRDNIRKKLNINGKKTNLRSFLMNL